MCPRNVEDLTPVAQPFETFEIQYLTTYITAS
jgi:hypothetical protein